MQRPARLPLLGNKSPNPLSDNYFLQKLFQGYRWSRFAQLIRGLVFYSTIYWKRASDGLNPPRLSPEERKLHVPEPDPDVIKPRYKPRAHLEEAEQRRRAEELARVRVRLPAPIASQVAASKPPGPSPAGSDAAADAAVTASHVHTPLPKLTRRERKRRAHRLLVAGAPSPGLVARLLGR